MPECEHPSDKWKKLSEDKTTGKIIWWCQLCGAYRTYYAGLLASGRKFPEAFWTLPENSKC